MPTAPQSVSGQPNEAAHAFYMLRRWYRQWISGPLARVHSGFPSHFPKRRCSACGVRASCCAGDPGLGEDAPEAKPHGLHEPSTYDPQSFPIDFTLQGSLFLPRSFLRNGCCRTGHGTTPIHLSCVVDSQGLYFGCCDMLWDTQRVPWFL